VLCRGAPKAPYPSYWEWLHVSGGGIGPSSTGGVACSPATAMRLCRLTGADPRSGVRGQRRAVVQPPRRSYPTGSPRPGGAVGEDTRLLPRLVSRSFSLGRAGLRVQVGDRHTRDYGAACRGPPGLDGRGSVGEFLTAWQMSLLMLMPVPRFRERRRG